MHDGLGRLKVFAAGMQQQFLPEPLTKPSCGEFGVLHLAISRRLTAWLRHRSGS